ncbi:hypothetical protein KK475_29110, partial [Klebsiella pneumoniae]|uniref:hypothetical protein n=1 Tax=Klebsiella pneumoniae TaxID=573 RepID=UPI001BE0BDBC
EESKDIGSIRVDELIGSIQTFKMNLRDLKNKNKCIVLSSLKEDLKSHENVLNANDDELALFVKQYKKYLKAKQGFSN